MRQGHSAYDLPAETGYQTPRIFELFYRQIGTFAGLGILALVVLAGIALATWNVADPSFSYANNNDVTNMLGFWGAAYADISMQFFGLAAVASLLAPFFWGILLICQRDITCFFRRLVFWFLSAIFFAGAIAALPLPINWPMPIGLGGVIGDKILGFFDIGLGFLPQVISGPIITALFAPLALVTAAYAGGVIGRAAPKKQPAPVKEKRKATLDNEDYEEAPRTGRLVALFGFFMHIGMRFMSLFHRLGAARRTRNEALLTTKSNMQSARNLSQNNARIEPGFATLNHSQNAEPTIDKPELEENFSAVTEEAVTKTSPRKKTMLARNGAFDLPHLEFLAEPKEVLRDETLSRETLAQNADLLARVLEDFGVKGEIINVRPGPVVTLYELEPAPGIKSSRIIGLADDIARSMSAVSARIAVVPGRNAIGIELPNKTREMVYLREMFEAREFHDSKAKLGLALGKTIGGESVIADLAKMPHVLVAGTTGSGKSVAINTMIISLVYRMTPEECRLIMVDPKMLELSVYDGIPHLLTPVVTDPKKAVVALKWAVREMEDRYRKMAKIGVRNIDGFNDRVRDAKANNEILSRTVQTGFNKETGEPVFETEEFDLAPMPYIVVIIDEMADLMMVAGKDIEGAVQRLAQMARAAGIHVIMATQRPSVDVITGTIKANFPTRISFAVTSKIDSRTILGEQGAEQLLGQGDMLFMMGGGRIQRVHGPFVGDAEVEQVVAHLKTQGMPDYLDAVMEDQEETDDAGGSGDGPAETSEDPYDQAVAIVLRDRKASTSYIQRRLGIGYNRAATIIERMEEEGIISPPNHAGKRDILIENHDDGF